jgi:outer membrane protein assembly factor BamD
MKMRHLLIVLSLGAIGWATSCKSEFERIRASGDPTAMYTKATDYYDKGEYQKAQALYELVISSYRGRKEAEDISYRYAYTYYHLGQYILAAYYFKNFVQTFGASTKREEADYMAAYSNYQLSPTFRLDQSYTVGAIEGFQVFVSTYPQSEKVAECNRLIDEMRKKLERKAYEEANLYFDLRNYQSAIQTYENLLKDYPETDNAERVRYMIARSAYLLAINSFVEKQEPRFKEAINHATEFLERYPKSEFKNEVSSFYDNSRKKLKQLTNVGYQN